MSQVTIIGAGLAGSLLAINLAKRGMKVDVYEARGDMRKESTAAGRSINLALSDRGIAALREVGMDEYMLSEAVPMYGRMIHTPTGETKLLRYSGRKGEYINSVSRAGLNIALINEAEKRDGVTFHFNEPCVGLEVASGMPVFSSGVGTRTDSIIATDGAGSAVRQAIEKQLEEFSASSVFIEHGYKELHIPPGPEGEFLLAKNALHIWPRHKFMMIALPNFDGSFTCTLFLAHTAESPESSFHELTDETFVLEFFNREFPDAVALMPTLLEDFFKNPTGHIGTLKCWPWNVGGKALLLGDSAHAVVPFYGQGMNCAFEDVRVLAGLIDQLDNDWEAVYEEYGRLRKVNTDAIADMAEENFYEMRDRVADPVFQRKREIETKLEQTYQDYFSKYSMVTFREDLPYSVAKERGNAQDGLLMEICSNVSDSSEIDLSDVIKKVRELHED
jgi:kynurenine 3-monooxygenase